MSKTAEEWKVGNVVTLTRQVAYIKKTGVEEYEYFSMSRYVCVQEATASQQGILVKVLGKCPASDIMVLNGEPFRKDDEYEGLTSLHYSTFRFPTEKDLALVLDIIRSTSELHGQFEQIGMHINLNSTFWVREVSRQLLGMKKKLQYFDAQIPKICIETTDDTLRYRLTLAFFQ